MKNLYQNSGFICCLAKNRAKIALFAMLLFSVCFTSFVQAQVSDPYGVEYGSATNLGNKDIRETVAELIKVALSMLGMVAFVIIIFGGFKWMLSSGDEEKVHEARQIIISGVIGLAIILSSYSITVFLINQLAIATDYQGLVG